MVMQRVPRVLEWRGELSELTFSRWNSLQQCTAKGLVHMLALDGQLPEPLPTRGTLVGRFHHQLMELAATVSSEAELDARTEDAIAVLQQEVARWPHLRKAGSVSGWKEVNASASLAMRAFAMRGARNGCGPNRVEHMLRSQDGLLLGRPDSFRIVAGSAILREYKSGSIRGKMGSIKETYLDQLTFYAVLIFDNYDVESVVGSLESLGGDRHDIEIRREQAQEFAQRVIGVVAAVNQRARSARSLADLANPSQDACSYCAVRSICVRFKSTQDELALTGEQLLAEGVVTQVAVQTGRALSAITLSDELRKMSLTLALPSTVVSEMSAGRRYQLLNLRRRGASLEWGCTSQALSYG